MTTSPAPLDPATAVGPVSLIARDRPALSRWYQAALGLVPLAENDRATVLGAADGNPILVLVSDPDARLAPADTPGLYHIAILVPSRADLGRWLVHTARNGIRLQGAADHLVSEAVYLTDPEGNGIEVYRDRPRAEWQMAGDRIKMANKPLDADGIVGSAEAEGRPYAGAPAGTTVGHVHLKVKALDPTRAFYEGLVGLDITNDTYPSALFASAGGYHHHFGFNIWESAGRDRVPGSTGLDAVTVRVPAGGRAEVLARLASAGVPVTALGEDVAVVDPSGNRVLLVEGEVDARRALALAEAVATS